MEMKDLVEKVTAQVLARLGEDGKAGPAASGATASAAPSSAAPAGAPAATTKASAPGLSPADIARTIDHTLLKPEASREQIEKLCAEAAEHHFCSVCVNATWTAYCARRLRGTGVKVCTVVGFPLGAMDGRAKSFEARGALEAGADEIDMVMNIGALKSGDLRAVEEDIRWVLRACRATTVLKVIIECALLSDAEKVLACQIAKRAGAHFVKTSTGFAPSGAKLEDVALMRRTVGLDMGVKAAGGVRSYEDAVAMIQAGASRLGTSAGVAIVTGAASRSAY